MKNIRRWLLVALVSSIIITALSKNLLAGMCIGTGSAMLMMIITSLETDKKFRN